MVSIQKSRNFQLAIGLSGIIIALATMAIPYNYQTPVLVFLRLIEMVASGLLIFGLLKQRSLHKKEIVLSWLICSLAFLAAILYNFFQYAYLIFVNSNAAICCGVLLAAAVLMCGMMYVMYNAYVKLIDDTDERLLPA